MTFPGLQTVWEQRALLLSGLETTVAIVAVSAVLAFALGLLLFSVLVGRVRPLAAGINGLIDLTRAVPFMLLCYLLYYGLPTVGIVLDNLTAGIAALTVYNAAYFAELLRGSFDELPRETIDAGHAFGFHGWQMLVRIIAPPVILNSAPMLGNQLIQIIKDSAFLMIIAVEELTYAANEIQATYYVPFTSLLAAVLFYWGLCLAVEAGVRGATRYAGDRR